MTAVASKVPEHAAPMARIPHSRPSLGPEDERAVAGVLRSGWVRGGPALAGFEPAVAAALGRTRAVAVTSGSAALHLALLAMEVGSGDRVVIPSYACASLLQAVKRAGAEPLVVDCDPDTFLMDPADVRRRLRKGTRALILVHSFGMPADPAPFSAMGVAVITDAAASLGAARDGRPAGSDGILAVGSFNANKMITTGGGGAVAGDDARELERVMDRVDYDAREDPDVRFNERMGDLAAGLGLAQLGRLSAFVARRREIAVLYGEALSGLPIRLPETERGVSPSWHRYVVRVPGGSSRAREALARAGIDSPPPLHVPLHTILGLSGFPGTDAAHDEALSLPIYPALSDEEAQRVVTEVRRCTRRR